MGRLRVLHVSTAGWHPREGIARTISALVERLDHEHHLAAPGHGAPGFAAHHHLPGRAPLALFSRRMTRIVAEVRPDLVHLHGGILGPSMALAPAFAEVPVAASVYSFLGPADLAGQPLAALADARASLGIPPLRAAAATAGPALARWLLRTGRIAALCTPDRRVAAALASAGPVRLAQGAADLSVHRAQWSDEPTIVFAGRAEPGRGVEELVAAFGAVRRAVPGARLRLLLLPGHRDRRWQDEFARQQRVEVSTGAVDLDRELAAAQVACLPFRLSMTITPPLVAAEAMAAGVPVVATHVPCLTPLVRDGDNGRLTPPRDPQALARALVDVVADRSRWERLSQGALRTIEHEWNWRQAAGAVDGAYGLALRGAA